jgi:4-carboxymuconolactone decarboxylase
MPRLRLISDKEGLTEQQAKAFDWIVESRGRMIRPYEVMLHAPGLSRPAAELGHMIRYEGTLSDHDRELAILSTGKAQACEFEWTSHIDIARGAGVSPEAETVLLNGESDLSGLTDREALIIGFVRELCDTATVSDDMYAVAEGALGTSGVVELTGVVGYYTLLSYVMNVAGAST